MKGGFIMRLQLKKFIAVTLCLSVVLSSCTIRPGNHSKEALSQRPVSTVDTTGSDPQTFVITLLEGQTTAMVNGTEAQLSVAPFLQNGSFYYPLADVVRLIGGGHHSAFRHNRKIHRRRSRGDRQWYFLSQQLPPVAICTGL